MPAYFDRQDVQAPRSREAALFRDLKGILSVAKSRAPALRDQLRGVDLSTLRTRADLARIPVLRRSDMIRMQRERPPFGGLAARSPGALKGFVVAPGPVYVPEGYAKDWWRAARAMHAAGFEKGDVVLNGFSYAEGAGARMAESGACALGCAVMTMSEKRVDWRIEHMEQLAPSAYFGSCEGLDWLVAAFEKRQSNAMTIKKALCIGEPASAALIERCRRSKISAHQCYAIDEVGVIAFETKTVDDELSEDLVVNEGMIVEIVRPGTSDPLPHHSVGEIVVTRLNVDFPLVRFATGDLSALSPGPSTCGRTNLRLRKLLGRVEERAPRDKSSAPTQQ